MLNTLHALIYAIALFLLSSSEGIADIKGDMDSLANQARYSADTFMQQSVELRLGYEYRLMYASEADAQRLCELAKKADAELEEIIRNQKKIKKQIENYNGEDWDNRYGDTGIWQMLSADICNTMVLRCQIDYYWAAASERHEQSRILNLSLDQLSTLSDALNVTLIKADIYALLGMYNQSSKKLAGELYRKILAGDKVPDEIYYPAAVAAQKLDPPLSPQVLDELAARLDKSECRDNFELNMTLAFLQRRVGGSAVLEKTVKRWPQAREFVGDLTLSDLSAQTPPQVSKLSVFEADCAAVAVLQKDKDTKKYGDVLEAMSQVSRLQTPRLLNATAVANVQKSPMKAIELFIKASLLPREPNDGYESPLSMAKQGAVVALNYFKGDPNRCEIVKRAVENYFSLAGNAVDEQVEYSYSKILSDCNDIAAAEKLLQKIVAKSNSEFGRRAKDDLSNLAINKSQSLLERGQLFEAADVLIAADVNACNCRGYVINLLARYVDKIDEYMEENGPNRALNVLGQHLIGCNGSQNGAYVVTLYAQIAVFTAQGQKDKLDEIEKLLSSIDENNLDTLTARARLSAAQGRYEDAAKQWGAICGILKAEPNEPPQHSYHWWQAKYFELENSLKIPNASRADVIHSIEVLHSSFNQIPPFWDKKLKALIQSQ